MIRVDENGIEINGTTSELLNDLANIVTTLNEQDIDKDNILDCVNFALKTEEEMKESLIEELEELLKVLRKVRKNNGCKE